MIRYNLGYTDCMLRRTLYIIGILWVIALLVLLYIYYARNFVQYVDTVPAAPVATQDERTAFAIRSSAFEEGGKIPSMYTCDEKQVSPPLTISGVPEGAQSLVLIMEDRDIPKHLKKDGTFLHWVLMNIPPAHTEIAAGDVVGVSGASGNGVAGYMGPCPPPQYEPTEHRYYFDLYALNTTLTLPEGAPVAEVREAMEGRVVGQASYYGRYERLQK